MFYYEGTDYPFLVVDTVTCMVDDAYEEVYTARVEADRLNEQAKHEEIAKSFPS